jgi:caa(3)-type oxidase subunit IV
MTEPLPPPSAPALIVTFLVLEVLAIVSWVSSAAGAPTAVYLAIAVVMMIVSATFFMELKSAHPLLRVMATTVLFFVLLLCAGVAGDVALRGG